MATTSISKSSLNVTGGAIATASSSTTLTISTTSTQYMVLSYIKSSDAADTLTITSGGQLTFTNFAAGTSFNNMYIPPSSTLSLPAATSSSRQILYTLFVNT